MSMAMAVSRKGLCITPLHKYILHNIPVHVEPSAGEPCEGKKPQNPQTHHSNADERRSPHLSPDGHRHPENDRQNDAYKDHCCDRSLPIAWSRPKTAFIGIEGLDGGGIIGPL